MSNFVVIAVGVHHRLVKSFVSLEWINLTVGTTSIWVYFGATPISGVWAGRERDGDLVSSGID